MYLAFPNFQTLPFVQIDESPFSAKPQFTFSDTGFLIRVSLFSAKLQFTFFRETAPHPKKATILFLESQQPNFVLLLIMATRLADGLPIRRLFTLGSFFL
jgi:hypothetical protein